MECVRRGVPTCDKANILLHLPGKYGFGTQTSLINLSQAGTPVLPIQSLMPITCVAHALSKETIRVLGTGQLCSRASSQEDPRSCGDAPRPARLRLSTRSR